LGAIEDTITKLERKMMVGTGRWVADFNESFRNYRVGDVTFDMFISGNTRMKGFIISRFFSFLLNPNYGVGLFAISTGPDDAPNSKRLRKWILAVKSRMREDEMKWSWFVIVGETPSDLVRKYVEEATDSAVGIAYLDVVSHQIVSADTYLGRQLKRYLKL